MKIEHDKYYTPNELVDKIFMIIKDHIKIENIKRVIEPSAGNGSFIDVIEDNFKNIEKYYYDIKPEHSKIIECDFLKNDIEYKSDTLVIGNPPFGDRNNLIVKFFKESVKISDYIGFILPISQFNNTKQLYEFDLILSYDLGIYDYSGVKLHCCFNLYKRPKNGKLNKHKKIEPEYNYEVIEFRRDKNNTYYNKIRNDFKHAICSWGRKVPINIGQYAMELYFYSDNDEYIRIIQKINWNDEIDNISAKKLPKGKAIEIINNKIKQYYEDD